VGFNREKSWNKIQAEYYKAGYYSDRMTNSIRFRKNLLRIALPAAAAVILAFFIGFYTRTLRPDILTSSNARMFNEVFVPLGAKSQITLSDGTKVWLNAGSRLQYPVNFMEDIREVRLEGEAYFNVAKMESKLFVVKTSDINIKVYGTQFNVKSYPEENIIQTTLVEGSLSVESIKGNAKRNTVFLKPNQTVRYYKTPEHRGKPLMSEPDAGESGAEDSHKKLMVIPTVDPLPITSWKDSKWIIVGEELDELAVKLERRYNVKITFEDESLKKYKFTGTLKEETFEQVLKIVQISMPILFTIVDNNVTFREDPSFRKKYDTMINNPN
jgi:ferric-dicitrate binding protein FerR (iron transport regulator)